MVRALAVPAVCVPLPVITNLLAVPALTEKVLEVAPVNAPELAVNVLFEPAVVGLRLLKVATPLEAATESVLLVNAVVLLLMVTVLLLLVTVLPY